MNTYSFSFNNDGLTVTNNRTGWSISYPANNPIVAAIRDILQAGDNERIYSWLEAVEQSANVLGDEVSNVQLTFAAQTYMIRRAFLDDPRVCPKIKPIIGRMLSDIDERWTELIRIIPANLLQKKKEIAGVVSLIKTDKVCLN
jgi:hypothetical protein